MGYESRVFVGWRNHFSTTKVGDKDYAQRLAIFDLSKMGHGFVDIFDKPIDFDMYKEDGNTLVEEDDYGDVCKYTTLNKIYKYLKEEIKKGEDYRRLLFLYSFVKDLKKNKDKWEHKSPDGSYSNLVFVHWGY